MSNYTCEDRSTTLLNASNYHTWKADTTMPWLPGSGELPETIKACHWHAVFVGRDEHPSYFEQATRQRTSAGLGGPRGEVGYRFVTDWADGIAEEIPDATIISHLLTTLPATFKNAVDIITLRPEENETLDSRTRNEQTGGSTNTASTTKNALIAATVTNPEASRNSQQTGNCRQRSSKRGSRGNRVGGRGGNRKPYSGRKVTNFDGEFWHCGKKASAHYGTEVHGLSVAVASMAAAPQAWIIDSGAFHHLSGDREILRELRALATSLRVKVANGTVSMATEMGSVHFHLDCGILLTIFWSVVDLGGSPERGRL
ncbi:hypothetical protein FPV67DRAFT_1460888 [Lyophyllum atratum]|nr:hypothetical protein FPV67DRAFT_1460888 [Lyophyllum atratum]